MKGCFPAIMGANASALVKDIGPNQFPANEHYFGFVNFGNTCYCNSVLQALFFCPPFREKILSYRAQQNGKQGGKNETLLTCLCDLFHNIATQKRKVGVIQPKKFVTKLRKENEIFDNYLQHDAHEFIIFLLNYIGDVLLEEAKAKLEKQRLQEGGENNSTTDKRDRSGIFSRNKRPKKPKKTNSTTSSKSFLNSLKSRTSNKTLSSPDTPSGSDFLHDNVTSTSTTPNGCANGMSRTSSQSDKSLNSASYFANENNDYSSSPSLNANKKLSSALPNGECQSESSTNSASRDHDMATQHLDAKEMLTWVHDIFQGTLTNETRCLTCETVSSKDENFFDLSVDVEQNTSISHCLRGFSDTETLCGEYKYYCEVCCSKQEAQKRMLVKKLPMILTLHLKRFKYMDNLHRHTKLSYRVVFPFELRLFNTSDDASNADRLYDLIAIVVHCGSGPNRGHYITIVKSHGLWLLFDDDIVEKIEPTTIEDFYGLTGDIEKNSESGYILFYQSKE